MDAGTVDLIVKFVKELGFPIAAFGVMVWLNVRQSKQHAAESAKWVEALENNTEAMNTLSARCNYHDKGE